MTSHNDLGKRFSGVDINDIIEVINNPRKPLEAMEDAISNSDIEGIRKAIDDGCDPKASWSWALRFAANQGKRESSKFLLPLSDVDIARAHVSQEGSVLLDSVIQELRMTEKHIGQVCERGRSGL